MLRLGRGLDFTCGIRVMVGAHRWYQSLYLVNVQMKMSNLLRKINCDDFGKADWCANESTISNPTSPNIKEEKFKCKVDTYKLS